MAIFQVGFRPFFLLACAYSIVCMFLWMLLWSSVITLPAGRIGVTQWHAHEMIYGYAIAVIAGFLLTAVGNWTGKRTASGFGLAALTLPWFLGRVFIALGQNWFVFAALADVLFMVSLCLAVIMPIVQTRQWRQIGVISKLVLLAVGNGLFYCQALGYGDYAFIALHGGLYLIVGLILTIASRVYPMFARNGLDHAIQISNPRWIASATLIVFLVFFINQLAFENAIVMQITSWCLFGVTAIRLWFWHAWGIWSRPLLWSIYLSVAFIGVGFMLFGLAASGYTHQLIALHAMAYGGIGLITLGMMARVTIGHTGRNVKNPPRLTAVPLSLILVGFAFRVIFPIFDVLHYQFWISMSQLFWIAGFAAFCAVFSGMLLAPRVDGKSY